MCEKLEKLSLNVKDLLNVAKDNQECIKTYANATSAELSQVRKFLGTIDSSKLPLSIFAAFFPEDLKNWVEGKEDTRAEKSYGLYNGDEHFKLVCLGFAHRMQKPTEHYKNNQNSRDRETIGAIYHMRCLYE